MSSLRQSSAQSTLSAALSPLPILQVETQPPVPPIELDFHSLLDIGTESGSRGDAVLSLKHRRFLRWNRLLE